MKQNQFLSCDWGTSSFRLRLVNAATGEVTNEVRSEQGIALTHTQWLATKKPTSERETFYKKIVADAAEQLVRNQTLPLILSGMASSTIGISELPYKDFPFSWNASNLLIKKFEADATLAHTLYLVSGMKCVNDIMRGEETILFGCEPLSGSGLYILPGTHSKHVMVENGNAVYFRTYMTGELFNLMSKNSILSNSLEHGEDMEAFEGGVRVTETNNVLNALFSVRVRQVLFKSSPVSNYQYLSGLIIGAELKDVKNVYSHVHLVGDGPLMQSYETALKILGIRVTCTSAAAALIKGHGKIFNEFVA
ncbi:2-dehydro-3-deoxygalactonokinase [soil metagenome]